MEIRFRGSIWFWKGPAPWYFVTVPEEQCLALQAIAGSVTYGWGMVPVTARVSRTEWTTSLFPKDGGYIVPVKAAVRRAERLSEGDSVEMQLSVAGV